MKAVSGKLSGERLGGRSWAEVRGAMETSRRGAIDDKMDNIVMVVVEVGEMLGGGWPDATAANRQRTENVKIRS